MKTLTVKNISLSLLILLCTASAYGQQEALDTLVSRFDRFRSQAVSEKIYAHLNQNFFLTGETLWFKVFAVDGTLHKPLQLSKVAYAEILDKGNFPVLQAKIKLSDGYGNGSFFLPATLSSGQYRLRIYTNWMKNFSPEFYFDEVFNLVNPFVIPEPAKQARRQYTIDFFPEGGNLVTGISSKIAFRILNERGRGENLKGWILNEKNDTITSFAARIFGIGHFFITPEHDTHYKAVLAGNDNNRASFPLPETEPKGYAIQLEDVGEVLRVTVRSRGVDDENIYLFAHARQEVIHAERKLLQGTATFELPRREIREGINHLTLFNDDLQPLCERLYFSYPQRALEIELKTNQKIFAPRRQVSVTIRAQASGSPTPANLSMSVYKVDSLSDARGTHIFPYLWMTSDLTGRIESPHYYFEGQTADVVAAMDDLMLTHGWRRFDWKNIISGERDYDFVPEFNGHIVTAKITQDGKAKRGVFTHLGSPGKIIRSYGSWSNEEGLARFEIKDFYGPRRVILQTQTDTTERIEIAVQDPFSPTMDNDRLYTPEISAVLRSDLVKRTIGMQVQDIFYYEQSANLIEKPAIDSSAFYGKADATYFLDDYTRFPVMEEVMREYVPGVFVRKRKDGFHFIVANGDNLGVLYGDPMILVDGVPVLDADAIMRMNPLRVKKLEVVTRLYYLGHARFSGIVSYTTYQGDLGGVTLDPRSVSLNYEGLQMKRIFFKPEYTRADASSRMPDQRYTLHWEPNITIDEDGTATVEFYTSDVPGQYRIAVEGLNNHGYSGSQTLMFTVSTPDNQ